MSATVWMIYSKVLPLILIPKRVCLTRFKNVYQYFVGRCDYEWAYLNVQVIESCFSSLEKKGVSPCQQKKGTYNFLTCRLGRVGVQSSFFFLNWLIDIGICWKVYVARLHQPFQGRSRAFVKHHIKREILFLNRLLPDLTCLCVGPITHSFVPLKPT